MEKIFRLIKKILPKSVLEFLRPVYHYKLALLGALFYRFPSRKIKTIGVTGTKGKSSVVEILAAILEEAGYKVASQSTIRFKIGDKVTRNLFKMTMPGRFFIQKFLRQAVDAGCDLAVIETTSEGAKQFRHKFIDLDALIFTNLAPEHIESHGSYEKYLGAKLSIASALAKSKKSPKFMIANADDKEAEKFFAEANVERKPFSLSDASALRLDDGINFNFYGANIRSVLRGAFNARNILAAATCALAFGVKPEQIATAVAKIKEIPGRAQIIKARPASAKASAGKQNFDVVVDYAHTPDSLKAIYETFKSEDLSGASKSISRKKLICVLGNTGGGRDTWKRPAMGKIAGEFCDKIILTNEDPYDEDPRKIVDEMAAAINPEKLTIEMDRRKAIAAALRSAAAGDVVLITGKGTDPYIMEAGGKKTPWDDKRVAEEELYNLQLSTYN